MGRNSWITFGVIAIVIISIVLVALLILVPQGESTIVNVYDENSSFEQSDYTYTQSKDISEDAMKEIYTVTSEDIKEGKASKLYNQGNVNPFSAAASGTTGATGSGNGNSTGSGSNNNVRPYSADDK